MGEAGDSKGCCTVPKVKVTLKKIQMQPELLDRGAGCHSSALSGAQTGPG